MNVRQSVVIHNLQNLRLVQPHHGLGLFIVVHEDYLLAAGPQQMKPGQRPHHLFVFIQNRVGPEAALQHRVAHIINIIVQMEADKVSTFTDMGDGQCMPNQAYRLIGIVRGRHQASLRLHIEKLLRNLRLTNNDAAHADFQRTPNHIRLVSADHNAVGIGKEQVLPAGGQCDHHLARNLVPQLPAGIENLSLDDGEQIVYRHAGNHRVADRAHVIVGHVPSGEHAIQRPILVGHWQHRNPVCLHGLPGPADCGSGGECGRRVVVQVPYLCTHIANEARRLKTEALQNGMGLIADLAQAGCLILPLPQSILQGGIGHGGND